MENYLKSVEYIKSRIEMTPEVGLVLGSGLGNLAEKIENPCFINYSEIPNFVSSTAPGHKGRFVLGKLGGKSVMCMQGRLHYYEGYTMEQVTYPIRIMKLMGIKTLILTNACGGVDETFNVGDFMVIKDHINFMGTNPLIGANRNEFGPRFCDMSYTYEKKLRDVAKTAAKKVGCNLREGIYLGYSGPSFETPAEIRAFRLLGASVVGMSTVPEAIVASHCSLPVLAISCITNMAAGVLDQPLSEKEVIEVGNRRAGDFERLIVTIMGSI